MKELITIALGMVACGACFAAGVISAQEPGDDGFQLPDWMQMGEEQREFQKSVGSWDVEQKVWAVPGQPPMESQATASGSLLWEGRFLQMDYHGDMMGMAFDGCLLMGFDRVDRECVAVWIDSLSTYMSVSRGKERDGVTTFRLNDPDFMTGRKKATDMVMKWIDDDTYTLTFIDTSAEGEPHATMEMKYIRNKG